MTIVMINEHIIGANLYSILAYAPFLCEKVLHWMDGWMGGWMEARAGLRIAYSNQKLSQDSG